MKLRSPCVIVHTDVLFEEWDPTESLSLVTLRSDLPLRLVDLLP